MSTRYTTVGTGRLLWPGEDIAVFADILIAEWDSVPPAERDVWLRRRLSDFVDCPSRYWRRRIGA